MRIRMRIYFTLIVELSVLLVRARGGRGVVGTFSSNWMLHIQYNPAYTFWLSHLEPGHFQRAREAVDPGSQTSYNTYLYSGRCFGFVSCVEFSPLSRVDFIQICLLTHGVCRPDRWKKHRS